MSVHTTHIRACIHLVAHILGIEEKIGPYFLFTYGSSYSQLVILINKP